MYQIFRPSGVVAFKGPCCPVSHLGLVISNSKFLSQGHMCQCARWHLEIPLTAWALKNWWEIHYKSGIETGNICGFLPRIRARDPSFVTDSNTCTTWPRLKKCGISWFRRPNSLMRLKVPRCLEKGCWIGRESWGRWNHGECIGNYPKIAWNNRVVKYDILP